MRQSFCPAPCWGKCARQLAARIDGRYTRVDTGWRRRARGVGIGELRIRLRKANVKVFFRELKMRDCAIQLTNHPGDLGRVAQALGRRGVNIKALAAMTIGGVAVARILP